jgi:hypothetical protein
MIIKSLLASAALAGAVALGSAGTANADSRVTFGFGVNVDGPGYGYYDSGYDGGDYGDGPDWRRHRHHWREQRWGDNRWDDNGWDQPPPPRAYGISCDQGRGIVASAGFRGVSAYSCAAPVYRYIAWRHGEQFRISVNFRGNIVGVNPVY